MSYFGYPLYPLAPSTQANVVPIVGTSTLGVGAATYDKTFEINGAGGYVITLPAVDPTNFPSRSFSIFNNSTTLCTVNVAGTTSDTMLLLGSSYTSVAILPGERFLVQNVVTAWVIGLESAQRTSTAPLGDNSIRIASTAFVNQNTGHGQCRLITTSSNALTLIPWDGNKIMINGQSQTIPSVGVPIANTGLTANTVYYVYVGMTSGVMGLTPSTSVPVISPVSGIKTNTAGDKTLVGMVWVNTSGLFNISTQIIGCLSWFNKQPISANVVSSGSTISTTFTEINPGTSRASFLTWANTSVNTFTAGQMVSNTVDVAVSAQLYVDGVPFGPAQGAAPHVATNGGSFNTGAISMSISEAVLHISALYGEIGSGSTGTFSFNTNVIVYG
jgi:hypothetical protein